LHCDSASGMGTRVGPVGHLVFFVSLVLCSFRGCLVSEPSGHVITSGCKFLTAEIRWLSSGGPKSLVSSRGIETFSAYLIGSKRSLRMHTVAVQGFFIGLAGVGP